MLMDEGLSKMCFARELSAKKAKGLEASRAMAKALRKAMEEELLASHAEAEFMKKQAEEL